ncbi:hypothetical protein [Luteirhabdus pelagi]|uniref:hypothetical protein n=1 Tax=Luteirhabdus pelagi TaxID=2792783 RepID=UPI00193AB97F|nr:hypothetical protein [Luteirhabdus pelagi]
MRFSLLLFLSLFLVACSSDDSSDDSSQPNETDYFPLTANSYWTYNNTNEQGATRDSLYVDGVSQQNGNTYTDLGARLPITGFTTNILANNLVRKENGKVFILGELSIPIEGVPFAIPLNDVIVVDSEASAGTQLSFLEDAIEQTIMDVPLSIEYSAETVQENDLESYTVSGNSYSDVEVATLTVTLAVTAQVEVGGISIPFPVLAEQEVFTVTHYFAADIGLIYAESATDYQLEDLSGLGIEFPFPTEVSTTATQSLDTYVIGE